MNTANSTCIAANINKVSSRKARAIVLENAEQAAARYLSERDRRPLSAELEALLEQVPKWYRRAFQGAFLDCIGRSLTATEAAPAIDAESYVFQEVAQAINKLGFMAWHGFQRNESTREVTAEVINLRLALAALGMIRL